MAGWHDTLDVMIRLQEWWDSQQGVGYGNAFVSSIQEKQPEMTPGLSTQPGWLASVARMQIDSAEPFFVTEDVMDMVDEAALTFEPEPLLRTDLITQGGFVLLPRPFFSVDRNGKTINTSAFSWGPCQSRQALYTSAPGLGTYLMCYSDARVEDDFFESMQQVRDAWTTTSGYSLWHLSPWWFGDKIPTVEDYAGVDGYPGNMYLWKWLQVFFRLSMQQFISADRVIPPRAFARRARRAGRDPGVLVVKLRRSRPNQVIGSGGEVDWDHRWLVRPHWRNQWYPSLGEHRQIYIGPYVKGPEDKPFKSPDLRVWTFNR